MSLKRSSVVLPIDLAAVCSVAFILLVIYVSMAKPLPAVPMNIQLAESSTVHGDDLGANDVVIWLDNDRMMLELSDEVNGAALTEMVKRHGTLLNKQQMERFISNGVVAVPINSLPAYLSNSLSNFPGINYNELIEWLTIIESLKPRAVQLAIRADRSTRYYKIRQVTKSIRDMHIGRINLITATKYIND